MDGEVFRSDAHGLYSVVYVIDELEDSDQVDEDNVLDVLTQPIEDVLQRLMRDLVTDVNDLIGIRISGESVDGGAVDIHIPFQRWSSISVIDILNRIERAMNSNETILLPIRVICVKRQGRPVFNQIEGRGVSFKGDFGLYARQKKSIIQINPSTDELNGGTNCFSQWVVIGLAHLIFQSRIQPIPELELDQRSYYKLTKSAGKFRQRKELSQRLRDLIQVTEVNEESFERIQSRFNVRLVLFSIESMICEFPSQEVIPFSDWKEVICGLLSRNDSNRWNHVDYITKPTAFHPETNHKSFRFCYHCLRPYKRRVGCDVLECKEDRTPRCSFCHSCGSGACPSCETMDCGFSTEIAEEECLPFQSRTKCDRCFVTLFSPKCKEYHLLGCRVANCRRCEECGNKVHNGLKCHEQRCFFCDDKFMKADLDKHQCFVKREKLKENKFIVASYDFECCIGEGNQHVPYLCTVWFPERHPKEEELARDYPHERRSDGSIVFVFWGLGDKVLATGVYQFFSFCCDERVKKTTFWAHNARAYDAILVKCYFAKFLKQYSFDIQRGQKFMSMRFQDLEIDFRDSLSFIPSSLRSMSADFGIQVETEVDGRVEASGKDFFPHSYVTEEYLREAEATNFITLKPPFEAFTPDYRAGRAGTSEEKEFMEWVELHYNQWGETWNVRQVAVKYCIKDTILLGKVLIKFRDQLAQMTSGITRPAGVDVQPFDALAYITLPSAMMSFFLSQMLEEKTIGVIQSSVSLKHRDAETWFLWLEQQEQIDIQRRPVCQRPEDRYIQFVSHLCQSYCGDVWYIFLDCYEHGCTKCFSSHQRNIVKNRTFGELWFKTVQNIHYLKSSGVKTRMIWTHEWRQVQKEREYEEWISNNRIEDELPLLPRDAYKGGKVECFKICYPGEIQMSDFVSQYPTTLLGESYDPLDVEGDPQAMLQWPFPVGIPKMEFHPRFSDQDGDDEEYDITRTEKMGIIKCRVLCPQNLYAPFLGYKVTSRLAAGAYEVMYGCCKTCMEQRSYPCTHTNVRERAIVGTWTLSEVRYAVRELGYKIIEVIEIWEYEESSTNLFRSFIAPFMVEKIRSKRSGLVTEEGQFTAKGQKVNDYVFELIGRRLTPDEIEDNPARRQVAKLAQNSFTGKWGEIEVHRTTRTFNEKQTDESRKLLTDPGVEIIFAQVLDSEGDLVIIEYEPKFQCSRAARRKNDIIVAHITAFGRTMLSRLEQVLGFDLLYEDTDSAFHKRLMVPKYRDGFRTGDLELELASAFFWVCCGRKWYAYMKTAEEPISKIKGFTLRKSNANSFSPANLFKLFVECKQAFDLFKTESCSAKEFNKQYAPAIEVQQTLFKTVQASAVEMYKQTETSYKRAQFQICSQKRYIHFQETLDANQPCLIDTFPFGYIQ